MAPIALPEEVMRAVDKIPAFPKSVQQVLALTADPNCSPRDLVVVLRNDPIFTLKILKVVNSPFIGLANQITSIQQASVYLGVNTLKNLALSLASIGMLPSSNEAEFDMNQFWLHSLATALISRKLALMLEASQQESADFFSAGLLHDIGKAVLALHMPEQFKTALITTKSSEQYMYETERTILNANHADVGALVAERWGFPDTLVRGIALHHAPANAADDYILSCVFAGNQICKTLQFGNSGENKVEPLPAEVQECFSRDLPSLVDSLPDMEEELEKARVFINP